MTVSPFTYVSGNPDNLVGGTPATMTDIQGPFYDLRAYLNTAIIPSLSALSPAQQVMSQTPVLDVGMLNQVRAGRQLTVADFTSLGLAQPVGLWNLTDLTNLGSDGRALANKGAVPFGPGINGVAGTSAVFSGSTGQALYIPDSGAADLFRIRTGSWGCWFRTAKRTTEQWMLSKVSITAGQRSWWLDVSPANVAVAAVSTTGSDSAPVIGVSDVADDRWHFAVATHDGTTLRLYIDGVPEAVAAAAPIFGGSGPLNVGGYAADAGTTVPVPGAFYGRVDEAFITADVLTEDQIRCLYAAKLAHTIGSTPSTARLNVRRRRRGGLLAVADFTTQPLRLYNFTAGGGGSVNGVDEGSNGVVLGAVGSLPVVTAPDGLPHAMNLSGGAHALTTDAGLPFGNPGDVTRKLSYGCWFKTTSFVATSGLIGWGTYGSGDARMGVIGGSGYLTLISVGDVISGPFVGDGQWHLAVGVEDNAVGDGVRRKLYLDGRVVGGSTVLNAITLGGANRFRVGALIDGTSPFTGQIDGAFVCGYALDAGEVARLWAKGSQALAPSPKNAGDHVEALTSDGVLFIGDTLESQHTVDLGVVA